MPASPVVAFRFEPELLERVDERADAEHRSRRNMLERMALSYLEREQPNREKATA
jgi:predicted transcriptional regulator